MLKNNQGENKTFEILRSILEVAPLGVYIVNSQGGIDYVNAPMVVISGDTHEQFLSLNVFEVPTYKQLGLDEKIRSVFEGSSFYLKDVKYTSYFGKKTTVRNMTGIPLEEAGEKKALIFVEDVTAIKAAEEEKERIINLKSQFISMVSHELRTPMGLIKGYLEMIQDTSIGTLNEKQKEFLNIAKENTDRLSRLINDVLDFQKLESGRIEFRMAKADINQLIEAVANNCQPLARAKSIKLNLILEKGIPEINFDKDRITQVLTNLINNAVKFTDQGSVEISTKRLENAVRVAIKDTGIGIKKEDLPRLFESFSQVGKNYDDKDRGGTGLDLAISQKIIQEHRGKMEVESEFQKGSSFSFYLPIVERRQ